MPMPATPPNTAEWLSIMVDPPETVSVLLRHLLERQRHEGLLCDPPVLLSLEDYHKALALVQQPQRHPEATAAFAAMAEDGRATLALPPAPAALQVKRVMLGPATPVEIIQSIEAYKRCAQ